MNATFTKLKDGSWGVRVVGAKPAPGASVLVTKRDGTSGVQVIGAVIWSGPDAKTGQAVSLCTVGGPAKASTASKPSATRSRNWSPCGYPGCHPSYCDECDGEGYRGYGR